MQRGSTCLLSSKIFLVKREKARWDIRNIWIYTTFRNTYAGVDKSTLNSIVIRNGKIVCKIVWIEYYLRLKRSSWYIFIYCSDINLFLINYAWCKLSNTWLLLFENNFSSITMTVCSYHVTYAFQTESTLYICLDVKELLARNRPDVESLSGCNVTQTYNHLVRKRTLSHFAKWLSVRLRT